MNPMNARLKRLLAIPVSRPFLFFSQFFVFILVFALVAVNAPSILFWIGVAPVVVGLLLMAIRRLSVKDCLVVVGCCFLISWLIATFTAIVSFFCSDSGIAPAFFGACSFLGAFFALLFGWMSTCLLSSE